MIPVKRKYVNIDDIQREYLPVSKKRIRSLVKKYLNSKVIGGRIYADREELERRLADPDREYLPLDGEVCYERNKMLNGDAWTNPGSDDD